MISWHDGARLPEMNGKPFRLRFSFAEGDFYVFWLAENEAGESGGIQAAGSLRGFSPIK